MRAWDQVSGSSGLHISASRQTVSELLRIESTGSVVHVLDDLDIWPRPADEVWLIFVLLVIIISLLVDNGHAIEVVVRKVQVLSGLVFHFFWFKIIR